MNTLMNVFSEKETLLRDMVGDVPSIVQTWTQSPIIRAYDGRITGDNPDYHTPICQREDGTYCNEAGVKIARKDIPEYILRQGPPGIHRPTTRISISLAQADAMAKAAPCVPPQAQAPAKRGRGRPKGSKNRKDHAPFAAHVA